MKIIPIEYGKSYLPESMIFSGGDKQKTRDIVFKIYLIGTDEKFILVDAGCETMPGFEMRDFIGPIKALQNAGISPDQITDVVITHAHHDHIECVGCFKNAAVHIQKDEYESGRSYISPEQKVNTFDDEYEICDGVKVIKIGGHSKGSCIVEIDCQNKKYIISGDECYLRECLLKKVPTGSSFCPEKSKEFTEKYSTEEYEVLLCHDN